MRDWSCDAPRSWPSSNCSTPRTRGPPGDAARRQAAALPIPPSPTTIASKVRRAGEVVTPATIAARPAPDPVPILEPVEGSPRVTAPGDPADLGLDVREHVVVRASDGVSLSVNLFLPASAVGPVPVIFNTDPYRKDDWSAGWDLSLAAYFVE